MVSTLMRGTLLGLLACITAASLSGCATSSPTARLSNLTILQQQADSAYAHQDWVKAAGTYKEMTERVPANAAYWFRLGNSYAHLDKLQPAADAYRAALQRDPRVAPAWHNLGSVLLHQSQAAFQQAAGYAAPNDPLKVTSALLAQRIGIVRNGVSNPVNSNQSPSATQSTASPAPASSTTTPPDHNGAGA